MPSESRSNALLEAALAYGRLGWRLVPLHDHIDGRCSCQEFRDTRHIGPCPNPGKHPRFSRFSEQASADENVIRAWWKRWPRANIGLICGAASGVWALDKDPRNGGEESRDELVYKYGRPPYTTTNRTGGGGTHEIFKWPADFCIPYSLQLADGLDIVGEGHVLVAPPSLHPSGREYAWDPDLGPDEQLPVDAPEWLLDLLRGRIQAAVAPVGKSGSGAITLVPIGAVLDGCGWLRHCRDDAAGLAEPEWYAMLSIVGRCLDGEKYAHDFSRPYAKYSAAETSAKLIHAVQAAGPVTCSKVRHSLGGGRFCDGCPNAGLVKSPVVLGGSQQRLPDPPPLNLDETGVPDAAPAAGDPLTASGGQPVQAAVAESEIDAAADKAIADNDPVAALAIAAQLAGQAEFTIARIKFRLREHFGKRLSVRDFDRILKGKPPAPKSKKPKAEKAADSAAPPGGGDGGRGDWRDLLLRSSRDGKPLGNLANAIVALKHVPAWEGVLWRDEFSEATVIQRQPPIRASAGGRWENIHDILTTEWLQRLGIDVSVQVTAMAVEAVANEHRFHPIRDYLRSLQWDGTLRIDAWLQTYLGVDLDGAGDKWRWRYVESVGAKWLISAVARVFEPGCKADCVLIIEGEQGRKKSSALSVIGGPWFCDEIAELGSKDSAMQMAGKWIIEISELESMTKSEVGAVKAFISRSIDRYRPPYAARLVESRRQCVFAGTVNAGGYLRDETGGRRFWPVACGSIDLVELERDRDQLWAEALCRYQEGATWWLDVAEVVSQAKSEQADRYRGDPWDGPIIRFLEDRDEVTIEELMGPRCLEIPQGRWSHADYNRVAAVLKSAGWKKVRRRTGVGDAREYVYRQAVAAVQSELAHA